MWFSMACASGSGRSLRVVMRPGVFVLVSCTFKC